MRLSDKQKEFWINCNSRWNIKTGATRAGKTFLDLYLIPRRVLELRGKEGLFVLLGNTRGTLLRNVIRPMQDIFTKNFISDISNNNTAVIFGQECFCLGADNTSHVDKIRGSSFKYCYGDEIPTWHPDVFQMLKSRLDKEYSRFDGTCNPEGPYHWFKTFIDSDADIYHQKYTIDDNPFLPPAFVTNLKKEYAGTFYYDRYILGEWALAEGLVYPMFNRNKHITDDPGEGGRYFISIDYGTVNPFSAGLWRINKNEAIRIDEVYYDSKKANYQKTDEEYYSSVEKLAGDRYIEDVIVDPSAASFITTIRRKGRFRVRQANNAVLDGVRYTSTLLKSGRLKIASRCKDAIREFGAYRWDTASSEDKVVKENDHAMDDIRYFCNTVLKREWRVYKEF